MARTKTPARKRGTIIDPPKTEIRKTDQQDRLTNLPQELLVNIISLLEMDDAVRTGTLSKKWKNLWTQVHNIVYTYRGSEYHLPFYHLEEINYKTRFLSFIDSSLMKCTSNIKSFILGDPGMPSLFFDEWIDKWIAHVVGMKVENLKLQIQMIRTPDCLFQSSTITKLDLFNMEVYTSTTVSLSALKSLLLQDAYIFDDSVEKILLGSPVLENLALRRCNVICRLNIISPSLKMLEIWNMADLYHKEFFTIKAPYLQDLKISRSFTFANCELVDVSSLLKATLTFHTDIHEITKRTREREINDYVTKYNANWIPMVTKLLKSLSYVGELIIGSELIQVLLLSKLSGIPSMTLFMCKHLTIETCLWKFDLPGIACLLENTPHLENLLIRVVPSSLVPRDEYIFYEMQIFFQDADQHLNKPSGKFLHLKNVKFEYCQIPCHDNIKHNQGGHFEFQLAEFILENAVALRRWPCVHQEV